MIDPRLFYAMKGVTSFVKKNPIFEFKPNPLQERFFNSKAEIRLVVAGNQSGKTTAGLAEDVAFMMGFRPWLHPSDPNYKTPMKTPVRVRLIVKDYEIADKESIAPVLDEFFHDLRKHKDFDVTMHYATGAISKVVYKPNGSRLHVISHKQEGKAEGGTVDVVHVDEPCPEKLWKASRRGMITRSGMGWFTLTPVRDTIEDAKYIGWLYDQWYSRADGERIAIIEGSTYDNVGFGATMEQVKKWEGDQKDSNEVATRVYGKFTHLAGVVHKQFRSGVHVLKDEEFPKLTESWPRYIGIDPHPGKGHFAVFGAVSPDEICYAYDCLHAHDVQEFAKALMEREPMLAHPELSRQCTLVIDVSFADKGSWTSDATFENELFKAGIRATMLHSIKHPGSLLQGIQIVENFLAERRLFFHEDKCKPVLREFYRYVWGPNGKPLKRDNDFLDCVRMMLHMGIPYYPFLKVLDKSLEPRYRRRDETLKNPWENDFGYAM